ncbi:uncharacterized protein LOC124258284 [Haliotis rubra]|uniref:uncharacterized protein LOC124258284 n=1 Tax=Haliotis rubra TaxID=36100 RepID=UPI001EE51B01|nr:uncharacterized protein LOC124258284 [Haliotis rubra]
MSSVSSRLAGYVVLVCSVAVATLPALAKSTQCDAPLGFENGNITDDQVSASSSLNSTYAAKAARFNIGEGWVAQQSNGKEYLQVDLLTQHNVTSYSVQGSRNGWYPEAVLLFYSQDGLDWESYVTSNGTQSLPGTPNAWDVVTVDLNPAVQARYLAFVPQHNNSSYTGLRLELYGCEAQRPIPVRHAPVSQDIQGSSEWLPSQSPYVINTLIRIRPGAFVKIQPGVKVIFNSSDAGFIVLGTLEARGLSGLPVVFTASNAFTNLTNMWAGIEVVSQGNLSLEFSHIYGADFGIKGALGSITIRHCNIHHNGKGIYLEMGDTVEDRIQISGTIISDNTQEGIYGRNFLSTRPKILLKNNTLEGSQTTNYNLVYIQTRRSIHGSIIMTENAFQTRKSIRIQGRHFVAFDISNNIFTGIKGDTGIVIEAEDTIIFGNIFTNCSTTSVIHTNRIGVQIHNNVFQNPQALYDLFVDMDYSENQKLNAIHNFWGSSDRFFVRSRICDFYCDVTKMRVEVDPYFVSEMLSELSSQLDSDIFVLNSENEIGGMLNKSVTLQPNQVLYVNRSVYIPEGTELTISKNTTLVFPYKQGVLVRGILTIQGEADANVELRSDGSPSNQRWAGIIFNATGSSLQHTILKHAETGIRLSINDSGEIRASDSIISQCTTSIAGQLWSEVSLSLERVKVNETSRFIVLDVLSSHPVSLNINESEIECSSGTRIQTNRNEVNFHVRMSSTKLYSRSTGFYMRSCNSYITINAQDSDFKSAYSSDSFDIVGGVLNITFRGVSVIGNRGATIFRTCTGSGQFLAAGAIDIQDSIFDVQSVVPLDVESGQDARHDVLLINNTFRIQNQNYEGVKALIGRDSLPWSMTIHDNRFENCGLKIEGSALNTSIDGNTFLTERSAMDINVQTPEGGSTRISQNRVQGGDVKVKSEGDRERLYLTNNTFNLSTIILMSPNVTLNQNTFLAGQDYDIKFEGSGYADKEINSTYNYWGTTDAKDIASRVYDSSYDPSLPTITFVPFYGFPNLTDPRSPRPGFISADGTLGGNVGGTVTLTPEESPYTVAENIVVGKLETLIIEAGVSLRFEKGSGIFVEGALIVRGNKSHPVKAEPITPGVKWSGVRLLANRYRRPSSIANTTVRLVGGVKKYEGRLEVNINGTWGTVCDYAFDKNDAEVACLMLGYNYTVAEVVPSPNDFGGGSGPIHLGNLKCTGKEETLMECERSMFYCNHRMDVAIRCGQKLLPTPQDIGNDVQLRHFHINDTDSGLEINGNVTLMENVVSSYSGGHGVTFKLGMKGIPPVIHIDGLESVNNHLSGVRVDLDTDDFISKSQIRISNCDVHSNTAYGVYIQQYVNISLTSCRFSGNSYQTIFSESDAVINIEDSIFSNGTNGAFYMYYRRSAESRLQISVKDSQFYDCDLQNNYRWSSNRHLFLFPSSSFQDLDIALINNTFHRINANILYCHTSYESTTSMNIMDNTFQNITGGIVWLQQPNYKTFQFQFVNNVVENASMSSSEPLMKIFDQKTIGGPLDIVNNTFSANIASHIILLGDIKKSETNMSITGNIFKDNICSETVNTSSNQLTLRNNIFSNPSATRELIAPSFARWYDIDARWNFWGKQDMDYVTRRICGFDIDMAKLFVHYLPYYLSEDLTDTSRSSQTTFTGGEITGEVHLLTSESPYAIKRSIFVRSEGILRIDSGVELQFEPNTGIYVDGVLVAGEGVTTERVLLTRATTMSWFGVVLPYKTEGVSETVRLTNGTKPNEGRLEIFVNGSWSTMCSINRKEALLLCKELGYGSEDFDAYLLRDRNGTVLQDLNCDDLASSLSDCQPKLSSSRYCGKRGGIGIRCHNFVAHTGTHTYSYLERVSIQDSITGLVVETPTVRLSNCHINNTEKVGLTIQTDTIDLDLNGSVVEHGQSTGILTKVTKRFRFWNGTTQHNQGSGIVLFVTAAPTTVEKMNIINNSLHGLETQLNIQIFNGVLHIKSNRFVDHGWGGSGLQLHGEALSNTMVYVEQNSFCNNVKSMDVKVVGINYFSENRCVIRGNIFRSTGQISVLSGHQVSIYIEDNLFKNSFGGDKCFLDVEVDDTRDGDKVQNISLSTNSFQNITGRCVVYVKSTNYGFNGMLTYNQIFSSPTDEGTVLLDSKNVSLYYNTFDNPRADYELKILLAGEEQINAEHNWWGSADPAIAGQRILHKDLDQRLLKVDYLPILTDQNFDCSEVQNCSDNGKCVRPNGCRCEEGGAGANCSDFDCFGVDNCNGNGLCKGPNQCNCSLGSSCAIATCHEVNDCGGNERGYCALPERCTCFPQFCGANCSKCAPLRWGDSCLPCPQCNHGSCNLTNGNCDCVADNWSGDLCDTCSETFYGPNCLPYTNVLNIIPSSGPDTGGTDVHIWGHNFPETDNDIFYCRFDSTVVNGTRMSKEHVMCRNPQHQVGSITVEISPDGLQFTRNQTSFTYYEGCPPGACGKTESPPHGHCFYGGCICTLPWSGQDCNVELNAPVISAFKSMQVAAEGDQYHLQLTLIEYLKELFSLGLEILE